MGLLKRFLAKPTAERRLLLKAWVLLVVIVGSLHTLGFHRTRRWLARTRRGDARAGHAAESSPIPACVESAARRVPGARCLPQTLAAQVFFARVGVDASLRVGVRRADDGAFGAHAWLEHEGRVIFGEARPEEFTPLTDFESESA